MSSGLLAILDDISVLMKHTATLSKIAAKKTAGLVGDDLAVNAEAMLGINPKRELAIVAEVAKGSAINKVFLIGGALGLSAVAPAVIPVVLMAGGAFLCYEGYHKTFDKHHHTDDGHEKELIDAAQTSTEAVLALEKKKINQAVTTDFILSAEIIAISLGAMAGASLRAQASALVVISAAMTVGVYGAVAGLVKLDDLALFMMKNAWQNSMGAAIRKSGQFLVEKGVPTLMKGLSIFGTAAMFIVGGEILLHGIPAAHHAVEHILHMLPAVPGLSTVAGMGMGLAAGVVAGAVTATGWKYTGPTITKALSAALKPLAPVVEGLKALNPFKKKPGVEATVTPQAVAAPVTTVEVASDMTAALPTPKEDLAKAAPKTEAKPPVSDATITQATSVTLNANRRP